MIKRLIAAILLVAAVFTLSACGESKYPPVESTAEEARVVMTLSIDGKSYEVKYELYRALFLSYHSLIDGGDTSVWSADNKGEYIEKIDTMILGAAADIYATLHHADKIGLNPYSASVEDKINEYIKGSVEGYDDGEISAEGFGGDYELYLASLKELGLNYSVQVLLYRYAIMNARINEHYIGTVDDDNPTPDMESGALKYTKDDVLQYYNGNGSARVLLTTLDTRSFKKERAEEIRNTLAGYSNRQDVTNYIMNFTSTTEQDATAGVLVGEYSLDRAYYGELTEEAFRIGEGEVSNVIFISSDAGSHYYILYKVEKSTDYYDEHYSDVALSYVKNEIGKLLNSDKQALVSGVSYATLLDTLDRSAIIADFSNN